MKNKFIKTSDEKTANLLRESGLVEVGKEGDKWVFVNNDKIQFSTDNLRGCQQTDILLF